MNASAKDGLSKYIAKLDIRRAKLLARLYSHNEDPTDDQLLSVILGDATRRQAQKWNPRYSVDEIDGTTDEDMMDGLYDERKDMGKGEMLMRDLNDKRLAFRKIGFGQCGLVFQRPGRDFVVKIARPGFHDALWSDFVAHFHVYQAFRAQLPRHVCRVPKVYSYRNKDSAWWGDHRRLFREPHDSFPMPSMALITERIMPLPRIARQALVAKYCPASLRRAVLAHPSNRDCLARVYLGRRRQENAPLAPNFSLRNFNLCLDRMMDILLPVHEYAAAMGEALAVMHWAANVDGYDVEFVLGCEADLAYREDDQIDLGLTSEQVVALTPHADTDVMALDTMKPARLEERRPSTRMWVLDFNLCSRWEERTAWEQPEALIRHLVLAFYENDPYYPLPLVEGGEALWNAFCDNYLRKSREILEADGKDERLANLPQFFITSCILREEQKLEAGLGHGHRDLKG